MNEPTTTIKQRENIFFFFFLWLFFFSLSKVGGFLLLDHKKFKYFNVDKTTILFDKSTHKETCTGEWKQNKMKIKSEIIISKHQTMAIRQFMCVCVYVWCCYHRHRRRFISVNKY